MAIAVRDLTFVYETTSGPYRSFETSTGTVALGRIWQGGRRCLPGFRPDCSGKFGERGRDAIAGTGVDAEFVVTATHVLQSA